MKRLSNTLKLEVVLAVFSGRVDFVRMNCTRLPWVSEAGASAALPMQAIVESEMVAALNGPGANLESVRQGVERAATRLQERFADEFSIFCSVHLHVILEEQTSEGIASLAARLAVAEPDKAFQELNELSPLISLERKPLDEIFVRNGGLVTESNFRLIESEVQVVPGTPIHFLLGCEVPVRCHELRLLSRETEVLRHPTLLRMEANSRTTVQLPAISAGNLRHLIDQEPCELTVHLMIDGRDEPLAITEVLLFTRVVLSRPPVALFLDIGSAYSKFCVVELKEDPASASHDGLPAALRHQLTAATENGGLGVSLGPPEPTEAFLDLHGLPHMPKATLDAYSDDELAAHFSAGISRLAERHYHRENRLISDVYWAFPNTRRRDFDKITEGINRHHGGAILGAARLVPESDCLRASFSGVLGALSKGAREAKGQQVRAKKKNKDIGKTLARFEEAWNAYEKQPWYLKFVDVVSGKRPHAPRPSEVSLVEVPLLQTWHREFMNLACDEALSDFIVFDAGGYSLDVFATFSGKSETLISKSFNAGSSLINEALIKEMKKSNPDRSKQEHKDKAEEVKRDVCGDPEKSRQHPLHEKCRSSTEKVYGKCIDEVLDRVAAIKGLKGFPLILTGGGSRNQFLHTMIRQKLNERALLAIPARSPLLYATLQNAGGTRSPEIHLFLCTASAFHPEESTPRLAPFTDILCGLAQLALKQAP